MCLLNKNKDFGCETVCAMCKTLSKKKTCVLFFFYRGHFSSSIQFR